MSKLFWPTEPEHVVIITSQQSFSNAQCSRSIEQKKYELSKHGVQQGTLYPLLAKPTVDCICSLLAIFELGATAVMVSPREPAHLAQEWIGKLCTQNKVSWNAATILRTSGSTAEPKNAVVTVENHKANARYAAPFAKFGLNSLWLLSLPLYHVSGLGILFRSLLSGGTIVIPDQHESLAQSLHRYDLTHLSLVSTQLFQLLEAKEQEKLAALTTIILGGSAISPMLSNLCTKYGLSAVQTYGLTESASQIAVTKPLNPSTPLFLRGNIKTTERALLGNAEIKFAPDNEILIKGDCVFAGYYDGAKLNPSRDNEGYFHTGDLGSFTSSGCIHIEGRKSNRIISGGENIQAEEIERCLMMHPLVEQAVVVARDDAKWGQRPVAFVKLSSPFSKGEIGNVHTEFHTLMKQHLAAFKIPNELYLWPNNVPQPGIKTPRSWFQTELEKITMTRLS